MRGPIVEDRAGGLHEIAVAGQHAGLSVVDEQYVEALEHLE
jgi:hypothetical protein